jgi:glycosyltransferase involved in cell wall biosynthesis
MVRGGSVVKRFVFAVPGDLASPTGGYAYDRRMIEELGRLGWQIDIVNLGDGFPLASETTRAAAQACLLAVPEGRTIVIDGLALGALPEAASQLGARNSLLALVHHPLALESGLSAEDVRKLHASERAALAAVRHVVVTSAATGRHLVADYAVPPERISVVPPGSDPALLAPGSKDSVVRLLSVGAMVPRKGFDVLIEALATLIELPWRLTIAGDRSRNRQATAQLDADIVRHALGDRIAVLGEVSPEHLDRLYVEADVFALASRFEGYGMAYAEAVAHGLPVVGTSAGAIPDTVPPGAAILVAPDNPAAFAQALRRVIEDPNERKRLRAAARTAAGHLPTWQASAQIFSHAVEAAG